MAQGLDVIEKILSGKLTVHREVQNEDHGDHALGVMACGRLAVSGWAARVKPNFCEMCKAVLAQPGAYQETWSTPLDEAVTCRECRRALGLDGGGHADS